MQTIYFHLISIAVVLIVTYGIVWLLARACFCKKNVEEKIKSSSDFALEGAFERLYKWYVLLILWTATEYIFVIIPFVANVIVIYITNMQIMDTELVLLYSIISLSFIVLSYAINPHRHKKCYRKAYCCLDNSINKYMLFINNDNANVGILNSGINMGEEFINKSYDVE